METRLKECPFCGGEANIISHSVYRSFIYYCSCSNQECHGFCSWTFEYSFGFEDKEKAIIAWNTRAADKLVPNENIKAPVYDRVTEGYDPNDCHKTLVPLEFKQALNMWVDVFSGITKDQGKFLEDFCARFGSVPVVPEVEDLEKIMHDAYFKKKELMSSHDASMLKVYAEAIHKAVKKSPESVNQKLIKALEDANDKCRSAYSMADAVCEAYKSGKVGGVDFYAFREVLRKSLKLQQQAIEDAKGHEKRKGE